MRDPVAGFAGDIPYADSSEYIEELSVFVDLRILEAMQDRLEVLRGVCDVGEDKLADTSEAEPREVAYLRERLALRGLAAGQTAQAWADQIVRRREVSMAAGRTPALVVLSERLALPDWMTETIIYYCHAYLDDRYADTIGAHSLYDVVSLLFGGIGGAADDAQICEMLTEAAEPIGYLFPGCDGSMDILHAQPQMDIRLYELITGQADIASTRITAADASSDDISSGGVDDFTVPSYIVNVRRRLRRGGKSGIQNLPYGMSVFRGAYEEPKSAESLFGQSNMSATSPYAYIIDEAKKLAGRPTGAGRTSSGMAALWGPDGVGKHTLAGYALDRCGMSALEYDARECLSEAVAAESIAVLMDHTMYALRECIVTGRSLVISGIEGYAPDRQRLYVRWLSGKAAPLTGAVCLLIETESVPDYLEDVYLFAVRTPDAITRAKIWRYYLRRDDALIGEHALPDDKIQQLANSFTLTPGQIKRAARQAFLHEDLSEGIDKQEQLQADSDVRKEAGEEKARKAEKVEKAEKAGKAYIPSLANLYACCYAVMGHPLKDHTQKVESPFCWDDIKMDPRDKALLRDVCDTVRNRHIVMQEWNFQSKVPYGAGVAVLFAGPPGTGKTMAAQVVANELGMELYKIDLSQLIDKYVGETEKNIRRIFDQAKKSNSVLFFDEADAIFNKRMDAKDANERFANIESSLLLQCVEEFDGISILATNNMTSIDNAFLRRFRYYLLFKEPDEQIRYEIWSSVFPKQAPVAAEVDYRELARIFKFTGAIIKNVALTAAYLAAAQRTPIGLLEIMIAIRREMEKNHRILTKEEMGSLGYLFARVCER